MNIASARAIAKDLVGELPLRWRHLSTVGVRAEELAAAHAAVDQAVVVAAWLHDVGYAARLRRTGHHSIDGADFLRSEGCQPEVVGLVAYHTGAAFESSERGLDDDLARIGAPAAVRLDVLTMMRSGTLQSRSRLPVPIRTFGDSLPRPC